ncbi:MAG: hypothetical protein Q4C95_04245 [Planctomycetia bacterium]|nr:hypothetical protein [Planctomycetia bacterium]
MKKSQNQSEQRALRPILIRRVIGLKVKPDYESNKRFSIGGLNIND